MVNKVSIFLLRTYFAVCVTLAGSCCILAAYDLSLSILCLAQLSVTPLLIYDIDDLLSTVN